MMTSHNLGAVGCYICLVSVWCIMFDEDGANVLMSKQNEPRKALSIIAMRLELGCYRLIVSTNLSFINYVLLIRTEEHL